MYKPKSLTYAQICRQSFMYIDISIRYIHQVSTFRERLEPVRTRVRSQAHNNGELDHATLLILTGVLLDLEVVAPHVPRNMSHAKLWEHTA